MFTDRDYDIWFLEAQLLNEKLEQEWRIEKLGSRAQRMQNAREGGETETGPEGGRAAYAGYPDENAANVNGARYPGDDSSAGAVAGTGLAYPVPSGQRP